MRRDTFTRDARYAYYAAIVAAFSLIFYSRLPA